MKNYATLKRYEETPEEAHCCGQKATLYVKIIEGSICNFQRFFVIDDTGGH